MNLWIKNSKGHPDAMLTFAFISFIVTTLCVMLSVVSSISVAGKVNVALKAPDATLVLGYLGASFTSYVFRRNKKDQVDHEQTMKEVK
jgi:hypothetical protein